MLDDGLEEGEDALAGVAAEVADEEAFLGAAVEDGGVELGLAGAEFEEQLEDFFPPPPRGRWPRGRSC